MTKLFISYCSHDWVKVDSIISDLRLLPSADDSPRCDVWQDKKNIRAGQDWWAEIIDAIIACDIFVFMVSHESVKNPNCRAELSYAHKRNRPIVPIILKDEYFHNPKNGKLDINYSENIPQELKDLRTQYL